MVDRCFCGCTKFKDKAIIRPSATRHGNDWMAQLICACCGVTREMFFCATEKEAKGAVDAIFKNLKKINLLEEAKNEHCRCDKEK